MTYFTLLWTTTVLTDKLNISLRPLKSTGQTLLDVLRNVIVQIFLLSEDLFRRTKISKCSELYSKAIKMTEEFYILLRI